MPITPRQLEVLDFIVQFIREHRYAPTLQEMADQFDLSRVTVLQHLEALEEKGYLERQSNQARGITVKRRVKTPSSSHQEETARVQDSRDAGAYNVDSERENPRIPVEYALPVVGFLAENQMVKPLDTSRFKRIDELLSGNEESYLLEVRCGLLRKDHIVEGDYLLVNEERSVEPGDLVVVQTEEEDLFISRYKTDEVSENGSSSRDNERDLYDHVQPDQVSGVVSGVIRSLD